MNCRLGDIAVIVVSGAGNEGKLVECLEFIPCIEDGMVYDGGPGWLCRSLGSPIDAILTPPRMVLPLPDSRLRPIRPSEEATAIKRETEISWTRS